MSSQSRCRRNQTCTDGIAMKHDNRLMDLGRWRRKEPGEEVAFTHSSADAKQRQKRSEEPTPGETEPHLALGQRQHCHRSPDSLVERAANHGAKRAFVSKLYVARCCAS